MKMTPSSLFNRWMLLLLVLLGPLAPSGCGYVAAGAAGAAVGHEIAEEEAEEEEEEEERKKK
jgi:ribosomal protein L12E/L44/L45/RPP1/RPP2